MSHKKWRRGGVRERGRKNLFSSSYSLASHAGAFRGTRFSCGAGWKTSSPKNACVGGYLLSPSYALPSSSTFVFLRSPFRATVHYALNRLVHSAWARQFFPMPMQGIYRCPFRSSWHFKSSYSRCNYSCFSISKTHFFSTFCCADGALFCWWCFIVDRDELKYFLKRFLQSAFISVIVIHSERYMYTYRIAGFQCHAIQNRSK